MALYSATLLTSGSQQHCKLSYAISCNPAPSVWQQVRRGRICKSAEVAVGETADPFVPERNYLDGEPDHVWRNGKPDYTVVNQAYLAGKTRNWVAGSLGAVVESVVKTLEMEISHKVRPKQWTQTLRQMVQSFCAAFAAHCSSQHMCCAVL